MSKVITFSRYFPSYHPRKVESTYFVEKIIYGLVKRNIPGCDTNLIKSLRDIGIIDISKFDPDLIKNHTIRAGHRFKVGDWFSPRVWSGNPYNSKQIAIAPDIQVKKTWDFQANGHFTLNGRNYFGEHEGDHELLEKLALNDGLSKDDFMAWFNWFTKQFDGQIICWNENIEY